MSGEKQSERAIEGAAGGEKRLERALLLAILLACATALSPNTADPDLWGHVQYGRDALAHGLPITTTYSYTAEGYRWINHENLAELLLALGADTIGPIGLLVVKCLLGAGVIALILWRARRQGVGVMAAGAAALLVSVNLAYHWSVRPQLLSYVYLALLIALLSWCFDGWEGRWRLPWPGDRERAAEALASAYSSRRMRALWWAPVLMLFWANSHGGFLAGYCILALYLACRALEAFACLGRASLGRLRRLAMILAASGLMTFINPYGFRLHAWLLQSLTAPRPEITEWRSPDFFDPLSIPLWLILAATLLMVAMSRRSRDFTHLAVLGAALCQSLLHQRHIPFFAIPFGFWMPIHIESVFRRLRISREDGLAATPMSRRACALAGTGLCLCFVLLAAKLYARLRDMPVDRSAFPVSAVQYMADHNLKGRMVVTYNWAQYIIAAFGGEEKGQDAVRVQFDGRFRTCYPQEIVDAHFDFILGDGGPEKRHRGAASPPFDPGRVLEAGRPDLVLIHRAQPHSTAVMKERRDEWVLLYQDAVAQLWGRASEYGDPASPRYLPPSDRIVTDAPQAGSETWPALPSRRAPGAWLAGPIDR